MVLPLKRLAADLTDVLPLLAVSHVMFAERAAAAEHLPAEAAVQERGLRGTLLVSPFPPAARTGSASRLHVFRH